ncbi:hypothetical protein [Sphingobacterium multivorum]|uniref:hypothetical protein n=1 Tax=Sphingobacterium multivorum TaxID=28454 RepID=UPI0028B01E54|nr:hypothetical protein [Sphingobacterium multivorum]
MNVLIGKIIKDLVSPLPYFDIGAGLVQVIKKSDISDIKGVFKKFPVEVNVTEENNLLALYPDEHLKGLFFVEDMGARSDGNNDWTSDLTLVCWFCPKKISSNADAVSAHALADITNLFKPFYNVGPISRLKINVVSIPQRESGIFSKYTFDEAQTQYLMPPFDFFALKLKCSYRLSPNCLTPLNPPASC